MLPTKEFHIKEAMALGASGLDALDYVADALRTDAWKEFPDEARSLSHSAASLGCIPAASRLPAGMQSRKEVLKETGIRRWVA